MSVGIGSSNWAAPVAVTGHVYGAKTISDMLFSPQERLTGGLGLLLPSLEK